MAMIDYGAIAFKNGKCISTGFFTPMLDTVGWKDTKSDTYFDHFTEDYEPLNLNRNYFAYVGDADCTVAFYKTGICICEREQVNGRFIREEEWFNDSYYRWYKWVRWVAGSPMKVTKRNGYLVFKWKYKSNHYKVYFGYGVDFDYFKKWHIVNYYRSLEYRIYKLIHKLRKCIGL